MGTAHTCKDDESDNTHECFCEIGHDHGEQEHRDLIETTRYLRLVAEQKDGA